jgi:hypothetical protein
MQDIYELKIFSWIDKNIIDMIINNANSENFTHEQIILNEWDETNGKAYIIKSWNVNIEIWGKQIASLWVWEIFWEMWLLSEENRVATVKAIGNVETLILTQDDLLEIINNGNESINKNLIERIEQNLADNEE